MAAEAPIHLVAFGAVTSVGARACVAMAAAQAGLSRITIVPDSPGDSDDDGDDGDGDGVPGDDPDACNVAKISTLAIDDVSVRGRALLHLAIDQALAPLPGPALTSGSLLVCVSAPARFDAGLAVARQLIKRFPDGAPPELETDTAHGSAPLFAIERALRPLARGELDFVLIAGVDVRNDPPSLARGLAEERVIGPGRSFGHVPGEAAAALLLAGERAWQRLGLPSRGTLLAAASAREPNPLGTGRPCLGAGVTQAVRQVLSRLPAETQIDSVTCDLNGERNRTDEWGFTVTRVVDRLREPDVFAAPAIAWGDCGAANGPLLLALATASAARDANGANPHGANPNGGAHLLVWTGSDGDERAAALVRAAATPSLGADDAATAATNPSKPPAWARELDGEILTEMAEECAFRYEQRGYQIERLTGPELAQDWRAIERVEEIMGSLARGLAECGAHAREIVTAAIDPEAPGSIYTAARTLLEAGQIGAAIELAALHVPVDPKLADAMRFAFQQRGRSGAAPEPDLRAVFAAGPALASFAVELAASMGAPVAPAALSAAVAVVPPAGAVSFLRALGQLATPEARTLIANWNDAAAPADPAVRQELALAEIRSGVSAPYVVLANAAHDPALILPAALVVDGRQVGRFLGHIASRTPPDADALLAAGIAGDAAAIPWLLDRLAEEESSAMAATALELLLGTAPVEDHEIPDEDETAPLQRIRRIARDRQAWSPIADPIVSRHRAGLRLRGGAPATAAATARLLVRPHLPILARRYLAYELAVRWGVTRPFDPLAMWRTQRDWISSAESAAQPLAAGSWELARRG